MASITRHHIIRQSSLLTRQAASRGPILRSCNSAPLLISPQISHFSVTSRKSFKPENLRKIEIWCAKTLRDKDRKTFQDAYQNVYEVNAGIEKSIGKIAKGYGENAARFARITCIVVATAFFLSVFTTVLRVGLGLVEWTLGWFGFQL
jgi:hypothetical protein